MKLGQTALRAHPLPPVVDGDKETKGRILIVAGSRDVPGAALLAATGAMRAGAGKLRIATVESAASLIGVAMPEAMVVGLPEAADGGFAPSAAKRVLELAKQVDAVVAGPGVKRNRCCGRMSEKLFAGEAALALDVALLETLKPPEAKRKSPAILLPNAEELGALLDCREEEVQQDPIGCGRRAAQRYRAIVLVKGVTSHVVSPDGDSWTYDGGAPARSFGQRRRAGGSRGWPARAGSGAAQCLAVGRVAAWRGRHEVGEDNRADRLPRARDRRRNPGPATALTCSPGSVRARRRRAARCE